MSPEKLIVFCKAPRPGTVKTRLAARLGHETAARIYMQLTQAVLYEVRQLEAVQLRFTPDDAAAEISPWCRGPGWELAPQGNGDLGERLVRAFDEAFKQGHARVVIIGTDAPEIRESDVREAFQVLKEQDLAIGPALDGGYWLIGLSFPCPALFAEQEWSTDRVLVETLRRAQARGLLIHPLRLLSDVDTEPDWRAYEQRCQQQQ